MDKATVALAEQVSLLLAPMVKAMISNAFADHKVTVRLDALLADAKKEQAAIGDLRTYCEDMDARLRTTEDRCVLLKNAREDFVYKQQFDAQTQSTSAVLESLNERITRYASDLASVSALRSQFDSQIQSTSALIEAKDQATGVVLEAMREQIAGYKSDLENKASKFSVEVLSDSVRAQTSTLIEQRNQLGALEHEVEQARSESLASIEQARSESLASTEQAQSKALGAVDAVKGQLSTYDSLVGKVEQLESDCKEFATYETLRSTNDNLERAHVGIEALRQELATVAEIKAAPVELPRVPTPDEISEAMQPKILDAVQQTVGAAVAALPKPKDGDPGPVGVLPVVENYIEGVLYERGALVFAGGGTWQATARTKTAPGPGLGAWQPLAVGVAGLSVAAGADARSFEIVAALSDGTEARSAATVPTMVYRGVFDTGQEYAAGDVVTYDGSLWSTSKTSSTGDTPSTSPDAWKLIVKRGNPGKAAKDGKDGAVITAGYVGEYEEGTIYQKNSIVTYASSLWLSKRATKERPPYVTNEDNEHWLRMR